MKLPIKVKNLIEQVNGEQIPHLASIIRRRKADDESLPSWYTAKPVEYYEGLLQGAFTTIEQLLNAYNCYAGFGYNSDENERHYFIK